MPDAYETLTPELYQVICELIKRDDVKSVSSPFTDLGLWRALADEQLRRATETGLPRGEAFRIHGFGAALKLLSSDAWGAEFGGILPAGCDLFIYPPWRRLLPQEMCAQDSLWLTTQCWARHYLLIEKDYGEMACAERTLVAGWVLYKAKEPYVSDEPRSTPSLRMTRSENNK